MAKGNKSLAIVALVLGIISIIAPFTYFFAALSFLSIAGLALAIIAFRFKKNTLNKVSVIVNSAGILVLVGYVALINYNDYKSSKTIYQYYLPKNYSGWVFIKENSKTAWPVPVKPNSIGGIYNIIIPATGIVETSSNLNDWHLTKYFWYTEKDTVEFKPEMSAWGDSTYKTLIHCEGTSSSDNNTIDVSHFFVSDVARNPQDTVILSACETLYEKLKEVK